MKLTMQEIKKGMLVKVVFYHSQMPESYYHAELGIIESVEDNRVTVKILTQNFYSDRNISQTIFSDHQQIVASDEFRSFEKFDHIESLDPKELESAIQHLTAHCIDIRTRLEELENNAKILHKLKEKLSHQ